MARLSKLVLALLLCLALDTATAAGDCKVEQKTPKRSRSAIRTATQQGLAGYQGESTTKNKPEKKNVQKKPIVEQKQPKRSPWAVRKATQEGLAGYAGKSSTKGKPKS